MDIHQLEQLVMEQVFEVERLKLLGQMIMIADAMLPLDPTRAAEIYKDVQKKLQEG